MKQKMRNNKKEEEEEVEERKCPRVFEKQVLQVWEFIVYFKKMKNKFY